MGNDNLTGGSGNDTFVKRSGDNDDTITDFENDTGPSNGDKIDVSAYGLNFDQFGFETEVNGLRVRLGADSMLHQSTLPQRTRASCGFIWHGLLADGHRAEGP